MDDYKKYLAEHILSEDKVITYRFLSRALKVHVNIAKQMLYEFHKSHNAKHPGAVHATYLLYGSKQPGKGRSQAQVGDDGDIEMASSMPDNESDAEIVPTLTLSLVPEEQLKDVAAMYDEITSVHVYSLGPHPMKDAALLSDAAHELFTLPVVADSSGVPHTYGAISNPRARRRERRGPAVNLTAPQHPVAKVAAKPPPKVKDEPKVNQQTDTKATKATAAPSMAGFLQKKSVPSLKRGGSSGIMESFAKGAAAAAKAKAKKAETSQPATPSGDDSSMQPMSEGEEDDSKVLPLPKAHEGAGRMSKKDNEEALRRMMDNDDDDEEEEPEEDEPEEEEPSEAEEAAEDSPAPEPKKEEPAEIISTSGGGRRRGRRKIMKKKQTLDDQGYLVTIQEPGWESFSEDEAPPPPPISKSKPTSSAPAAKPKKAAPKTGQGNIMSFFSKK